jgi:carboxyl-terminal processing protease
MNQYLPFPQRRLYRFFVLAAAFAAGILVERAGRLVAPDQYPPPGAEKAIAPFWETWHLIDRHYVKREAVDDQHMARGAIRGLLASLGDVGHTRYLTPEELEMLNNDLSGQFVGIGIRMSIVKQRPTVVMTMPHSPARSAGLKPGDVLLEVDGTVVMNDTSMERIAELIRGKEGAAVHVRIVRQGQSHPLDFDIRRAKVDVPDVAWSMLPGVAIAHLAIQNFGHEADSQVKAAVEEATKQGAKGLIVDIRGNSGGLKDQAVAVTSEFLKDGNVFLEQDAQGRQKAVPVTAGGSATEIPLCVLIDGGTGSSAEIFAGAIQDHGRGKLIGSTTVGTGTVLQAFSLSDRSAVLLAVAQWLTPNGRQIWHQGITPDIPVAMAPGAGYLLPDPETGLDAAALTKSGDKQLLRALDEIKQQLR